jgi:hypothetical protein
VHTHPPSALFTAPLWAARPSLISARIAAGARVVAGLEGRRGGGRGDVGRWSPVAGRTSPSRAPLHHRFRIARITDGRKPSCRPSRPPTLLPTCTKNRTYRYFLPLRRSALAFGRHSTTRFPLRSALHDANSPSRGLSKWKLTSNTCSNRSGASAARVCSCAQHCELPDANLRTLDVPGGASLYPSSAVSSDARDLALTYLLGRAPPGQQLTLHK